MWIFESVILDMVFLVLPILATLGLVFLTDLDLDKFTLAGIIVFTWIDSGHVYTTALRTYFSSEEFKANKRIYIQAPLIIFSIIMLWLLVGGYLLWDFVLYATIYHNIRQYYGVTRWYQKNISSKSRWQPRFLYFLTVIPVILFHFREGISKNIYVQTQLPSIQNSVYFNWGLVLYFAVVIVWIGYQMITLYKNPKEFATSLSVFVPALGYACGFLLGRNLFEVAAPIIAGHGVGYMGLMSLSLQRVDPVKYKSFLKGLAFILFIAVAIGSVSDVIEQNFTAQYAMGSGWLWVLSSFGIAAVLTPLLLHYYVDALIWSGRHRESHIVFSKHK